MGKTYVLKKFWRCSLTTAVISTVSLLTQGLRPWARRDPVNLPRLVMEITCHTFLRTYGKILTLIAVMLASLCFADDLGMGKRVQQLYDASDYSGAIRCLEGLLKGELSGKERNIARYNLATTYLANCEWERALAELGQINLEDDPPPLFVLRLHANQAVAYWTGAELTAADLDEGEPKSLSRCDEALGLLEKAWREWQVAASAARDLATLEGDPQAPMPKELAEMREGIKERQAELRRLRTALHVLSIPYSELLSSIHEAVTASVALLDQVGSSKVEENGRRAYLLQLGLKGRKLMTLWEGLEKRIDERLRQAEQTAEERHGAPFDSVEEMRQDPEVAKALQSQQLLMMADGLFRRSLDFIKRGESWEARSSQAQAAMSLAIIGIMDQGQDPLYHFLWERHRLASELANTSHQEFLRALRQEREEVDQFCIALAQGVSSGLPQLEGALVEQLIERLADPNASLSQVEYDPFYYAQLMAPEVATLIQLREEATKRGGDHHLARLRALREKFEMRELVEQKEYENVVQALRDGESAVQKSIAWGKLKRSVDQALRLWHPAAWLGVRLDELQEEVRGLPSDQLSSACDPLIQVARSEGLDQIASSLVECRRDVDEGSIQLSHDHPGCAEVCMLDARRWIERGRSRLEAHIGETPAEPLAQAIEEQKHALSLNLKSQEAGRSETLFEPVISISERAQKEVLAIAELISAESLGDPEKVALFQSGLGAAQRAHAGLGVRWPNWAEVREEQERAIEYWAQLQSQGDDNDQGGSDSKNGEGSGDSSQDQQEESESDQGESDSTYFTDCPHQPNPEPRNNLQEPQTETSAREEIAPAQVFEWLQQMDQDDRPPARGDINVRQGVHPW
jgi:hypothetical protein